ncbi:MAG TPA: histidinol-phosphatase [Jatrophihabitans sp.]
MQPNHYSDDLTLALELADLADGLTMARFGADDLVVESKPDLTPVSDADKAVERALRERLAIARPEDAIWGEEYGVVGDSSRRWVIDPIDGTKNFVRTVPVWATLISLMDGPESVVGVVSAPALGRRWWAHLGGGAYGSMFGNEPKRLAVSKVATLQDASISYASVGAWKDRGLGDQFLGLLDRCWRTRAYGDFYSYMLVAEGSVDLAAEPELSLWDMAALAPIVTEAGGRFTGLSGQDGPLHGNAAASNGLLHDALLAALS